MLYPTIFSIFSQILCILEKKQIQWVDKCNIHRINRPLIQDLEWNMQCEMFAILYSCTLRARGNAGEGATGWEQDPWVGRDWQLGWLGLGMAAFCKKASPVSEMLCSTLPGLCIECALTSSSIQDFWAMLETLCMSSMHDSVFWFVSAGHTLCCASELMVTSEGKTILLVQSQVWILYC